MRFAARLYFEHLLDQDHYLEWFIASLRATTLDTLPIWLLTLQIYWRDLVRYRKLGHRLAETLLEKLQLVCRTGPSSMKLYLTAMF